MLLGARQFFERRGAPTPPLPYDAEVEYLESTGTQWIDTGIVCHEGQKCEVQFCFTSFESSINDYPTVFIFGAYRSPRYTMIGAFTSSGTTVWRYGIQSPMRDGIDSPSLRKWYSAVVDSTVGSKEAFIDGVSIGTSTTNQSVDYSNYILFASAQAITTNPRLTSCRVSSFKVTDTATNQVIQDLIPVRFTNEQGVSEGAMYDRVSGALFRNAGTGAFMIGPDKS